jgi:histone acetyltransferase (RNA polymerase elongator complex component)
MTVEPFDHPLPPRDRRRILPVFLPFQGCPGRCIYCSQHSQTGTGPRSLDAAYDDLNATLERIRQHTTPPTDIGFFGGTFTFLPRSWQDRFLNLCLAYRESAVVDRIRCSTRPDAVAPEQLERLRELGLDMVELGVQSFDDEVLERSGRGYGRRRAVDSCRSVMDAGLELAVQLLPGLPGHGHSQWMQDLEQVCRLRPSGVRVYPCVVLRSTVLAELWADGLYSPWTLDQTVERLAAGALMLASHGIGIMRIGLAPEQGMLGDILDGPWHPALGFLVRSAALHASLQGMIGNLSSPPTRLMVPRRHLPEVIGYKGRGRSALGRLGLPEDAVQPWDEDRFLLLEAGDPS